MANRTLAVRNLALVGAAAVWFLSASAFISGRSYSSAARDRAPVMAERYESMASAGQPEAIEASVDPAKNATIAAIAAVVGLALSLSAPPVNAQGFVESGYSADGGAGLAVSRSKRTRPKAEKPKAAAVEGAAASTAAAPQEGGGVSFSLPSIPRIPNFIPPEKKEVKKKVIISPADDLDEDELPEGRRNWPLLAAAFIVPNIIFSFFWIAGSLDII